MAKKDFYEVLGVTNTATPDEIKKAYRKLAKTNHPDVGGDAEAFKEIAEAYEVLSDKDKKDKYDKFGMSGFDNSVDSGGGYDAMADFFKRAGFTQRGQRMNKGSNLTLNIKLTLEEIFTGVTKKFTYKKRGNCTDCNSTGGHGSTNCSQCGGTGMRVEVVKTPFAVIHNQYTCDICDGNGTVYQSKCETCKGEGTVDTNETIDVNVPAGIVDSMQFLMSGKGHSTRNGISGDLIINITELKHDKFVRAGNDLRVKLKLNYHQLILGDKVETTTIEGTKLRVTVPEFSNVNNTLRIPKKGMTQLNNTNRGDMIFELELSVDKEMSAEELELVKKIKELKENIAS